MASRFDAEDDYGPTRDARFVRVRVWRDEDTLGLWLGLVDGLTWMTRTDLKGGEAIEQFWRAAPTVLAAQIRESFEGGDAPEAWHSWSLDARELVLDYDLVLRVTEQRDRDWRRGDTVAGWTSD
jgi:hypothetical protein